VPVASEKEINQAVYGILLYRDLPCFENRQRSNNQVLLQKKTGVTYFSLARGSWFERTITILWLRYTAKTHRGPCSRRRMPKLVGTVLLEVALFTLFLLQLLVSSWHDDRYTVLLCCWLLECKRPSPPFLVFKIRRFFLVLSFGDDGNRDDGEEINGVISGF
ncbi:unnamed protein product, partial [Hapterophycus canaliculatus]